MLRDLLVYELDIVKTSKAFEGYTRSYSFGSNRLK